MLLQENLAWHELTGALRTFRVPSLVIFILDTTLRYIAILGQEASDLLTALKLRSVGHNPDKKSAMSGVSLPPRGCSSWPCWPMSISSSAWKESSHDTTRRRLFRL